MGIFEPEIIFYTAPLLPVNRRKPMPAGSLSCVCMDSTDLQGPPIQISRKKLVFSVSDGLRRYLRRYLREQRLPISYDQLRAYTESIPVLDRTGRDTLWETAIYPSHTMDKLYNGLKQIYTRLKAGGNTQSHEHLYIDRVDYCLFGNTHPFRVRIVNRYNDVWDYFYVKVADASRIYGLELEQLLSPFGLNYLTDETTLIEEHIAGIPGDQFIEHWLKRPHYNPKRIAKDFVKFNERCFIRLLGDMRAYNFVIEITPDFDDYQFRIRPIDFDQQAYEGQAKMYLPQFFKENYPYVSLALQHFNPKVIAQYQQEERSQLIYRMRSERARLSALRDALKDGQLSTPEKIAQLRSELSAHYEDSRFERCQNMSEILEWSLKRVILKRK